jgi:hypothetical protein
VAGHRRAQPRAGALESLFRVLVFNHGLPPPVKQFEVRAGGRLLGRADFAWPEFRLLVEIDGYEFHRGWDAFVSDRRRQNGLELVGWTVLRYTARISTGGRIR